MPSLFSRKKNTSANTTEIYRQTGGDSRPQFSRSFSSASSADARPLPDLPPDAIPSASRNGSHTLPTDYSNLPASANSQQSELGRLTVPGSSHGNGSSFYSTTPGGSQVTLEITRHSASTARALTTKRQQSHASGLKTQHQGASQLTFVPPRSGGDSVAPPAVPEKEQPYPYGYTAAGLDIQLDVQNVILLVRACGEQIRARGIDSPLIFSSMAIDLSPTNIVGHIRSFLSDGHETTAAKATQMGFVPAPHLVTPAPNDPLPASFAHEIRFANTHDLAALIKWGLARIGHVLEVPVPAGPKVSRKGEVAEETIFVQQRGFLEMDLYLAWRDNERRHRYPAHAFSAFIEQLQLPEATLLAELFSLLSSATSYSMRNGMTPTKISRLFGVLLFGLPEDDTFARTYEAYLRASNATEHLFLAYIRDHGAVSPLPTRLLEHIEGYPSMLTQDISGPARNAKAVPITQIERTVRLYSADLVQSACEMDVPLNDCPEWVAAMGDSEHHGKDPQLSDRARKLVNLRTTNAQGRKAGESSSTPASQDQDIESYSTLASKEWGDFMSDGFAAPDSSKFAFDLRESERLARHKKRETVQWSQFMDIGFKDGDDGLEAVLSFDDGLKEDMQRWPEERAELMQKLRQQTKKLPAFPYDTTPYLVASPTLTRDPAGQHTEPPISRMEESFAEVWADYLLGSGWSNRDELTHRAASFVVLQYKSRRTESTVGSQSTGALSATSAAVPRRTALGESIAPDSRSDAAWFVISEVVPLAYRDELEAAGRSKGKSKATLRKLNVFRTFRKLRAANGSHEEDPNDPFRPGAGGTTKVLRLNDPAARGSPELQHSGTWSTFATTIAPQPMSLSTAAERRSRPSHKVYDQSITRSDVNDGDSSYDVSHDSGTSLLSSLTRRRKKKDKAAGGDSSRSPQSSTPPNATPSKSFSSDDFETRSLHDADDELAVSRDSQRKNLLARNGRRKSKDDSWLDISMTTSVRNTRSASPLASPIESTGNSPIPDRAEVKTPTQETNKRLQAPLGNSPSASPASADSDAIIRSAKAPSYLESAGSPSQGTDADHSDAAVATPPPSRARPDSELLPSSDFSKFSDAKAGGVDAAASTSPHRNTQRDDQKAVDTRDSAAAEGESDSARLARMLRQKLQPVGLPPTSPESASARSPSSAPRIDPFAKDHTTGRVGRIAGKFGGPGKVSVGAITPQTTGGSFIASPTTGSAHAATASDSSSSPTKKKEMPSPLRMSDANNATTRSELLAPVVPPRSPARPSVPLPPPKDVPDGEQLSPSAPPSPRGDVASMRDADSIYPDDAASNYSRDTFSTDDNAPPVPSLPGASAGTVQDTGLSVSKLAAHAREHIPTYPGDEGRTEEEDLPMHLREPYQPGMPLDNVLEESESVLSGSNV